MTINLQKGQRISLKKEDPSLNRLMCGLGWDVNQASGRVLSRLFGGQDFDLDASVFCLNKEGRLKGAQNLIYFAHRRHPSGAISHQGDNLTGAGEGDDEEILVDLLKMPADVEKLMFVVNIYDAEKRQQEFKQVKNAFVRLVNLDSNREIARYSLSGEQYSGCTGMILAEVYRHNGGWNMFARGDGERTNMDGLVQKYT